MNKVFTTVFTALFLSSCTASHEVEGNNWTEENWKKEKGSYGWVFPYIDKNADGKVTAAEYDEFQNYKKQNPNWESELKPTALKSEKTTSKPTATKPQKANEGIPQGIEALEASLNEERMAQAVEMFEKLDKNKDGKITVPEVPEKQFKNKTWVQANLNGDMVLTWEEELIWQYNFQNRKAKSKSNKGTSKSGGSGSPAWVGDRFSSADIPKYKADEALELLPPELELAIMKKLHTYDKIMNVQLMPANTPKDKQADDVTGEWLIFTTMTHGQGMHKLTLKQQEDKITGTLEQLIYGPYPWINAGALERIPLADSGKVKGEFTGLFMKSQSRHNLFYLHRTNPQGTFEAIFSATVSVDGQTAIGTLVNTSGMHGMMLMVRRKALSRYKHLLDSDSTDQTELTGTKASSKSNLDSNYAEKIAQLKEKVAQVEKKSKQLKEQEAALVDFVEKIVQLEMKSKELKAAPVDYAEKIAQFKEKMAQIAMKSKEQKAAFAEKMAQIAMKSKELKKLKEQKTKTFVTESPIKNEGIPKGVKALEASLNEERIAQAVEMFEKLDKNKDGKITVPEVPEKQFKNKAWIQANLNGDMILTWEEELIWQYNFQKKKAAKKKK